LDYTIMGNAVNLAARLEGVNKQYGTWILMSEITKNQAGDHFVTRQLDRVRVVGIHEPVRLYELLEEKGWIEPRKQEVLELFHRGLEFFEEKRWKEAIKIFDEALKLDPEDGPAATFKKRCQDFMKKPPAKNWDGVFSLNMK